MCSRISVIELVHLSSAMRSGAAKVKVSSSGSISLNTLSLFPIFLHFSTLRLFKPINLAGLIKFSPSKISKPTFVSTKKEESQVSPPNMLKNYFFSLYKYPCIWELTSPRFYSFALFMVISVKSNLMGLPSIVIAKVFLNSTFKW